MSDENEIAQTYYDKAVKTYERLSLRELQRLRETMQLADMMAIAKKRAVNDLIAKFENERT